MATAKGGFDCEFVTAPPRSLECPICLLQLGDTWKVTAQIQKSVLFINTGPKPLQLTNIASHPFNACIVNNA